MIALYISREKRTLHHQLFKMKNISYEDYLKLFKNQYTQTEQPDIIEHHHGHDDHPEYFPVEVHLPHMPSFNIWRRLQRGVFRILRGCYDTTYALVTLLLLFCMFSLLLYYSVEVVTDVICGYATMFNSTLCIPQNDSVTPTTPSPTTTTTTSTTTTTVAPTTTAETTIF